MMSIDREQRRSFQARLVLAIVAAMALAGTAGCGGKQDSSSQDSGNQDPPHNCGGPGVGGAGAGGSGAGGSSPTADSGAGGATIDCSTIGCGPTPMCGAACSSVCGCCSCAPGSRSGDLICAQPGCYLTAPASDAGQAGDASPDNCGSLDHPCAADEICYSTTEGGGLSYSCVKFAPLCGTETPGCGCLRSLCFGGTGECANVKPGLVFCTTEGAGEH